MVEYGRKTLDIDVDSVLAYREEDTEEGQQDEITEYTHPLIFLFDSEATRLSVL